MTPKRKIDSFKFALTPEELQKLKRYADSKGVSAAHVMREYVRRLPNVEEDDTNPPPVE